MISFLGMGREIAPPVSKGWGTRRAKNRLAFTNGRIDFTNGIGRHLENVEPTFIAAPFLLNGRLVPLFADHAWSEDAAFAVYPRAEALPQRVRAIIDHVADALTMDPPWDRQLRARLYGVDWDVR